MVDWYEAAQKESQRVKTGKSAIQSNSESLYEELWKEIKRQIADLRNEHGTGIRTNGSHFDRIFSGTAKITARNTAGISGGEKA
jgi:hypothetical protein